MARKIGQRQRYFHPGVLWRHPDFLKLWLGESVSLMGSQVTTLALPLTAVVLLKATAFQMGILSAVAFAPFLFVTLFAGVWIDHVRQRPILIITNFGRAVLLGCVPFLAVLGQLRIEYLFLIALGVGVLTVFFQLSYEVYLPRLIHADQLLEGNSKLSLSSSIAELGGPGLAGVLVQLMTAPVAILVDAFSFLFSGVNLLLIRKSEAKATSGEKVQLLREINEGIRSTVKNRFLLAFAGEAATYNLFWQVIQVVLVLYAIRQLHFSPLLIGVVFALGSVGALLSALLAEPLARAFGIGKTMIGAQMLSDVVTILIPLTASLSSTTSTMLCMILAFFFRGAGNTLCNVQVNSVRQVITPDHLRGRTNAVYRLLVSGVFALGAFFGGLLGERFGLGLALWIGAIGVSSSWLWLLFSPLRSLRHLPLAKNEAPSAFLQENGRAQESLSGADNYVLNKEG